MTDMNIPASALLNFLQEAFREGWSDAFILGQLILVSEGARDERLHGLTCKALVLKMPQPFND